MLRALAVATSIAAGVAALTATASAQNYPSKSIRLIVPFPAGGPSDVTARIATEFLSPRLGQPIVVENKPGAGTAIGLDLVAKSPPDGYTLVWGTSDGLAMLPAVKKSVPYKVPDDFAFIATAAKFSGQVVSVNPKLPFKSMAELIAYAKANPGKLRYGSPGVGSGVHLGSALIAKSAGIEMIHVPFQGQAPAITATVGGHIDTLLVGALLLRPHVESGALRPLAVADRVRHPNFPDVPTLSEAGVPDVIVIQYVGLLAPAGTPEPVLARLQQEMAAMAKDAKVAERIRGVSAEPAFLTSAEFKAQMQKDLAQWRDVAQSANIVVPD